MAEGFWAYAVSLGVHMLPLRKCDKIAKTAANCFNGFNVIFTKSVFQSVANTAAMSIHARTENLSSVVASFVVLSKATHGS